MLQKAQGLSHTVKVYIPTTFDVDKVADDATVKEVESRIVNTMCRLYGGCTAHSSTGYWIQPDTGRLIAEHVTIAESKTNDTQEQHVESMAKFIAHHLKQECVSVEIDGIMYFVEADKSAKCEPLLK